MSYSSNSGRDSNDGSSSHTSTTPSKSSKNSKTKKSLKSSSKNRAIGLGNSLVNLNMQIDASKTSRDEKHKVKSHGTRHKIKSKKNSNTRQILTERLRMYNAAEHKAREMGEIKKARHLYKEVQLLNALIAHHEAGNIIDPDNIPPEIDETTFSIDSNAQHGVTFMESQDFAVIPFADLDSTASSNSDSEMNMEKILGILRLRRDQYKISVVQNKTVGNTTRALEHLNIIKMFDSVIKHIEMGQKVDLNELPGPPECPICHLNIEKKREDEQKSTSEYLSESSVEEHIVAHSTILQELQQRLRAFEIMRMNAKRENNLGETLRLDQILKLYREVIKLHRSGKSVPVFDLPSPPGFPSLHDIRNNI